jgi:hypothetical protein
MRDTQTGENRASRFLYKFFLRKIRRNMPNPTTKKISSSRLMVIKETTQPTQNQSLGEDSSFCPSMRIRIPKNKMVSDDSIPLMKENGW